MTARKQVRSDDLQAAIGELAALFEFGELMATTQPTEFIRTAAREIDRLRARERQLLAAAQRVLTTTPHTVGHNLALASLRDAIAGEEDSDAS